MAQSSTSTGHPRLPIIPWGDVRRRPEDRGSAGVMEMDCPLCGQALKVPGRAINTRCTQCHKHLFLENVIVADLHGRTRINTCGTVAIEPTGRFSGELQASSVVIAGRVMGSVVATASVTISRTGKFAGVIATRELQIAPDAIFQGEAFVLHEDGSFTHVEGEPIDA